MSPSRKEPRSPAAGRAVDTKRAELIAARIEDDIIAAGWPIGKCVGSEVALAEQYGVSRSVLREAVRIVEHHQVAAMRRGPVGGLVVQAPDTSPARRALVVNLDYAGTTVGALMEARLIFEPLAFALAAQHRTPDDLAMLRRALAHPNASGPRESAGAFDKCLHSNIARLSRNVALELFVDVLLGLTDRYAVAPLGKSADEVAFMLAEAYEAHESLVDALERRDVAAAHRRVTEHLEVMGGWLSTRRDTGPVATSPRRGSGRPIDPPRKLAEVLAGEMFDDIAAAGWPVGKVLGSEPELLERYGCGRAAFREAVRLLEHHSVARTRRGPGGGLVVTAPGPAASVTAMALYLEYAKVPSADLRVVRTAMEIACLDRVLARGADPEVARTLRDAHQLDATSNNADLHATGDDVHHALADLSGNPIFPLFLRIVTTLSRRHNVAVAPESDFARTGAARRVATAHSAIVDAVICGDGERARAALIEHLDSTLPLWLL